MSFGPTIERVHDWKRMSKNIERAVDAVLGWDFASWYRTNRWRMEIGYALHGVQKPAALAAQTGELNGRDVDSP